MLQQELRKIVLEQSKRAGVGHIGSSLSIIEILISLYKNILHIPFPNHPDRDRFILSKGHAALALYAIFHKLGWISKKMLDTFCMDGSHLGVHPDKNLIGVDFSTGSLGQGLCFGVGAALAASLQKSKRKIYVLMSDAECNEGSVWEAVMFAAHHRLKNLIVIIDDNKQQALGYTKDVLSLQPLIDRWHAFGWQAEEVDGHDIDQLTCAMQKLNNQPQVIIAHTIFGKGVSFMESKIAWHYLPLSDQQYHHAINEIDGDSKNNEKGFCNYFI